MVTFTFTFIIPTEYTYIWHIIFNFQSELYITVIQYEIFKITFYVSTTQSRVYVDLDKSLEPKHAFCHKVPQIFGNLKIILLLLYERSLSCTQNIATGPDFDTTLRRPLTLLL